VGQKRERGRLSAPRSLAQPGCENAGFVTGETLHVDGAQDHWSLSGLRRLVETQVADRVRKPSGHCHRASMIQMRPIFEEFIPRSNLAGAYNLAVLF
jgi:hypothetical protein